jgi:hypothetical protein
MALPHSENQRDARLLLKKVAKDPWPAGTTANHKLPDVDTQQALMVIEEIIERLPHPV